MMKVASGGELSRFLLALKVALADRGSAPTLVFDEIDTAVGGAVADAIGARLSRLAGRRAGAVGDPCAAGRGAGRQPSADRQGARARATGTSSPMSPASTTARRREEIARMLAGATVTDEARAAADRLILGAA